MDLLFTVTPIVGVCNCIYFVLRYFVSFLVFAIILRGRERAGCFA